MIVVTAAGGPTGYGARCLQLMFAHYRAYGFTGSPRVLTAVLGRPPRIYAKRLAELPVRTGDAT